MDKLFNNAALWTLQTALISVFVCPLHICKMLILIYRKSSRCLIKN